MTSSPHHSAAAAVGVAAASLPGPVVVTGATGRQGGAVARHLLDAGIAVRALTRNLASARR
jgi:NADP-dependent 3-hydroxy acid dehydrogenase YdfG